MFCCKYSLKSAQPYLEQLKIPWWDSFFSFGGWWFLEVLSIDCSVFRMGYANSAPPPTAAFSGNVSFKSYMFSGDESFVPDGISGVGFRWFQYVAIFKISGLAVPTIRAGKTEPLAVWCLGGSIEHHLECVWQWQDGGNENRVSFVQWKISSELQKIDKTQSVHSKKVWLRRSIKE